MYGSANGEFDIGFSMTTWGMIGHSVAAFITITTYFIEVAGKSFR